MRFSSGHFEESPWGEMLGWGRVANVRSDDDLESVRRLMAEPGDDRRAVIFEWMTRSRRRSMLQQLNAMGITLRPFDDSDRKLTRVATSVKGKLQLAGAILLASPFLVVMRCRGRKTEVFAATLERPPGGAEVGTAT